jgi:cephalosporin hydroxylase
VTLDRHLIRRGAEVLVTDPREFWRRTTRYARPMRRDYRRRFKVTLRQWLLYHSNDIMLVGKCRWMGAEALKNPLDAWIYQEILYEVRPEVIVEIGSYSGGSTLYFANLLDLLGTGIVVSVDRDRSRFDISHPRIRMVTGDSSSPDVVEQVRRLSDGKTCLVVHDGDHRKEKVLEDLEIYSRFVTAGSYLIVEDGIIDLFRPRDGIGEFYSGPLPAIDEFLARHRREFAVDRERERYVITYNPRGFLRRVR